MKYQVYQDDKPADCHNFKVDKSWCKSTFDSFEEAKLYALKWAYPLGEDNLKHHPFMDNYVLGSSVDLSMSEFPVIMKIATVEL